MLTHSLSIQTVTNIGIRQTSRLMHVTPVACVMTVGLFGNISVSSN